MKKMIISILAVTMLMTLVGCKKKADPLPMTAQIEVKADTYFDNQKAYFIIQAANLPEDGKGWFAIVADDGVTTLEQIKEKNVYFFNLELENAVYEIDLAENHIGAGKYLIVVCDENQNAVLVSKPFKVIETNVEKDGWGDPHSTVYWEDKYPNHHFGTFNIYIGKQQVSYHYDIDEHHTLKDWIASGLNMDGWIEYDGSIVSPDKKNRILNQEALLQEDVVFDCELNYKDDEIFEFYRVNNPNQWPVEEFFTSAGLPVELLEIGEYERVSYRYTDEILEREGVEEVIIDLYTKNIGVDFFRNALSETKYTTTSSIADGKPYLISIYSFENQLMRLVVTQVEENHLECKFICNPFDV